MDLPPVAVLRRPGLRSEYARLPPHDGDAPSTTKPGQLGISFSGHRGLVWATGGRAVAADLPPGSAVVTGAAPIHWLRVREPAEALEIYPDPELLMAAAAAASRPVTVEPGVGGRDATLLAAGAVLRRAHVTGAELGDVAASTLAHRLAGHVVHRYGGVPAEREPRRGLLERRALDRVAEVAEARLDRPLGLGELAEAARLSPFHFARAFTRSTGLTPHRYVTARRMDRARQLLWTTDRSVADVAQAVGYENLSHFRRVFREHHGVPPSALR